MDAKYATLSMDELRATATALDESRGYVAAWAELAAMPWGKTIVRALRDRLSAIREFYVNIMPSNPSVGIVLAGAQEREKEIVFILDSIEKSKKVLKDIDAEINSILKVMQRQESHTDRADARLVFEGAKPKEA